MAAIPPIHLVTDDRVVATGGFLRSAAELMEAAGVALAFHLRAPAAGGRRMYEMAAQLVARARSTRALLFVNERLDVALAAGADGAQIGVRGVPLRDARRLLQGKRLGASVHSRREADAAAAEGADFLLAGTVYPSASHPGRPGAGPDLIRELGGVGLPLVAIGGITPDRVADVRRAGASGIAVLSGVWGASDRGAALRRYLGAWQESE